MTIVVKRHLLVGGAFLGLQLAFAMLRVASPHFILPSPEDIPIPDVFFPASFVSVWFGFAWSLTPRFRNTTRLWPVVVGAIAVPTAAVFIYLVMTLTINISMLLGGRIH